MHWPRLALKLLSQLGIQPLLLNARYRLWLITGHYRGLDAGLLRDAESALGRFRPVFTVPEPGLLPRSLSRAARASLQQEADEIIGGRVRLFGHKPVPLKLAIGGHLRHWTAYELERSWLSSLGLRGNDIKFFWEPARFGWAYTLGRAFRLGRRE
jgi:hypothetical protein